MSRPVKEALIPPTNPEFNTREVLVDETGLRVMAIPMPFSRTTGFSASGPGDFTYMGVHYPEFLALSQLLLTAIEDHKNGTPSFKADPRSAPTHVAHLLELHAARRFGPLKKYEIAELERQETHRPWFFPSLATAYAEALMLRADKAAQEDGAQRLAQAKQTQAKSINVRRVREVFSSHGPDEHIAAEPYVFKLVDRRGVAEPDPMDEEEEEQHDGGEGEEAEEEEDEEDGGKKKRPKIKLGPVGKPREKVTIYYIPVPKAKPDPEQPYAGYIMVIIQNDPNWNPGVTLERLLSMDRAQRLKELPHLANWEGRGHAAFNVVSDRYHELVQRVRARDPRIDVSELLNPTEWGNGATEIQGERDTMRLYLEVHPSHPFRWATFSMACNVMMHFGADPSVCKPSRWVERLEDGRVRFRSPASVPIYHMPSKFHLQGGSDHVGVFHWVWPHDERVRRAMERKLDKSDPAQLNADLDVTRPRVSTLKLVLEKEAKKDGAFYDTDDILQHFHYQNAARKAAMDLYLPPDPAAEQSKEAYTRYQECLKELQAVAHSDFCQAMKPQASVADTLRPVIEYAYTKVGDSLTCKAYISDPNMDPWGNMMIRDMTIYRKVFGVEDPLISFLGQLGSAAFDFKPKGMRPQVMICGPPGAGKTYPGLRVTEKTMIQGTTREEHYKSALADTVNHDTDVIVLCDEGESTRGNQEGPRTNLGKVAHDSGFVSVKRTVQLKDEVTGQTTYVALTQISVHNKVTIIATNYYRYEMDPAIADRFIVFVKAKAFEDTIKLDFSSDKSLQAQKMFHARQVAIAWVYKAIMVGAIPDIDTSVYNLVIGRMLEYLKKEGVGDGPDRSTTRTHRKVLVCLRHFTVMNAVEQALNLPGGACFEDPNWRETLPQRVSPLLYPTKQLFLWSVLLLQDEWIDVKYGNIIRAACAVAGLHVPDDQEGATIDKLLASDTDNLVQWKQDHYNENGRIVPPSFSRSKNFVAAAGTDTGAATTFLKLDVNYVSIPLNDQTYTKINERLPNGLSYQPKFIKQVINSIAGKLAFYPQGGPLIPVDPSRRTDPTALVRNGAKQHEGLFVMKRSGDDLLVAPEAALLFDQHLLIEAFTYALVSKKMHPQKYITPIPLAKSRYHLKTIYMTRNEIDAISDRIDTAQHDVNNRAIQAGGQQVGGLTTFDENVPLPRKEGICFERPDYCNEEDSSIITSINLVPNRTDEEWEKHTQMFKRSRSKRYIHIKQDMDDWCAQRRHYQCGFDIDQPPMTQQRVIDNYYKHLATYPDQHKQKPKEISYQAQGRVGPTAFEQLASSEASRISRNCLRLDSQKRMRELDIGVRVSSTRARELELENSRKKRRVQVPRLAAPSTGFDSSVSSFQAGGDQAWDETAPVARESLFT